MIVQGAMLGTAPAGLLAACWRSQIRFPKLVPAKSVTCSAQVARLLQRYAHYVSSSSCNFSLTSFVMLASCDVAIHYSGETSLNYLSTQMVIKVL